MIDKNCIVCGKKIDFTKRAHNSNTCGKECARERNLKNMKKANEKYKNKRKIEVACSPSDINAIAKARGTSYGKIQEERLRQQVKIERKW